MTKQRFSFLVLIICMVAFAGRLNADDSIKGFAQKTLDGKTVKSETLKGMPLVINIGSHW